MVKIGFQLMLYPMLMMLLSVLEELGLDHNLIMSMKSRGADLTDLLTGGLFSRLLLLVEF
jgi:hypothetical protein